MQINLIGFLSEERIGREIGAEYRQWNERKIGSPQCHESYLSMQPSQVGGSRNQSIEVSMGGVLWGVY